MYKYLFSICRSMVWQIESCESVKNLKKRIKPSKTESCFWEHGCVPRNAGGSRGFIGTTYDLLSLNSMQQSSGQRKRRVGKAVETELLPH